MKTINVHFRKCLLLPVCTVIISLPSVSMADDNRVPLTKLRELSNSQVEDDNQSHISSASVIASSSSSASSNGPARSQSMVMGTASGNASAVGGASGNARSRRTKGGENAAEHTVRSSANARFGSMFGQPFGQPMYPNIDPEFLNGATASTTVVKNGVSISRKVYANGDRTITTLKATDKTQEVSVREGGGTIEIRIGSLKPNPDGSTDERVYRASNREKLRQQAPAVVRMVERYERMAGTVNASVDTTDVSAFAGSKKRGPDNAQQMAEAQQMMKEQLRQLSQQHANSPQIQQMIRRMLKNMD